jgi:pimeloyl-ACP methyl ester carboxylesterase
MGSLVVRHYARLFPPHVAALVIVDGLSTLPQSPPDPEVMGGPNGLATREEWIRGMFTPSTPLPVQRRVLEIMLSAPEATAVGSIRAIYGSEYWVNHVIESMRVFGIYAATSPWCEPEQLQAVPEVFPNFEYTTIPESGHFLMMEKPQEFNRILMNFLNEITF